MKLKTFRAATMAEALADVKRDLGADAVILHTRSIRDGGVLGMGGRTAVEITASTPEGTQGTSPGRAKAVEAKPAGHVGRERGVAWSAAVVQATEAGTYAPVSHASLVGAPVVGVPIGNASSNNGNAGRGSVPRSIEHHEYALRAELGELRSMIAEVLDTARTAIPDQPGGDRDPEFGRLYANLCAAEVPETLAARLCAAAERELGDDHAADRASCRRAVLRQIEAALPTRTDMITPKAGEPRVIALVGPTGVGKTTCIAKLAAAYHLREGLRVGLLTADTYRIAAVEQLKTYADIIDLPMRVATTPDEARSAVDALRDCDVALVDTAGRGQHDRARLEQLTAVLDAIRPTETHLTLAATTALGVLESTCDRFASLAPDRLLFTKLDEAVAFGALPAVCAHAALPISYIATGQEVPGDLRAARSDRLARLVLDGTSGGGG